MKKFKFTLEPVYGYKQTVEKLQKAELSKAQQLLAELRDEERELEQAFERAAKWLEEAIKSREGVIQAMQEHNVYYKYLTEKREQLQARIIKAEIEKERCEKKLITTMKEIKTYTKLREEQYQDYRKEVQIEEEKNMGDLVTFNYINE